MQTRQHEQATLRGETQTPPHDRRTGDERRQELVLVAYQIIAEQGFEGLRTRTVAARAGVNIATLHYYFASKEDLIRGVVDYIERQFIEQEEEAARRGPTARERLHAELMQALEVKRDRPELQTALHELFLRSLRDPAVREIFGGWTPVGTQQSSAFCTRASRRDRSAPISMSQPPHQSSLRSLRARPFSWHGNLRPSISPAWWRNWNAGS